MLNLLLMLRSADISCAKISDELSRVNYMFRTRVTELAKFESILKAMKLFTNERNLMNILDEKILESSEKLTDKNWIELLNKKSILRQRNIKIIEACAYNLMNRKAAMDIDDIQTCFLSSSLLSYNDEQFFKYLLEKFGRMLSAESADAEWLKKNKASFDSIINSIGMLKLRDAAVLNNICSYLANKSNNAPSQLLLSFVITCGNLNFMPKLFEKVFAKLSYKDLRINDSDTVKDKIKTLNFVWSLCILNQVNNDLIGIVMDQTFWQKLIGGKWDDSSQFVCQLKIRLI